MDYFLILKLKIDFKSELPDGDGKILFVSFLLEIKCFDGPIGLVIETMLCHKRCSLFKVSSYIMNKVKLAQLEV